VIRRPLLSATSNFLGTAVAACPERCSPRSCSRRHLCGVLSAWLHNFHCGQSWVPIIHKPSPVFTSTGLPSGPPDFTRPTHIYSALRSAATAAHDVTNPKELDAPSPLLSMWVPNRSPCRRNFVASYHCLIAQLP
jgi:hypothetical protein